MAEYQLYCFAQSGNAYRAALMLNLIGADWQPVFVDFFAGGETRTPEYRADVNEMGEAPVLAHDGKKLSQSGVILTYLAERSGQFAPRGEDERLEALRWIIFDNQKLYYPAEEFGFDIAADFKNIGAWLERVKALPGWKHPYELMPGHPLPA